MKKQKFLKPYFVFLLLFTFSMLVIGCGENSESKVQTERVEGRQLMKENSTHANEADVVVVNTSDSESSRVFPVDDEIRLDEWMQLVKDIKSTLGKMDDESKQVLQMSESR
ncbi:MAG: hypothetical protein ACE5GV_10895 [Candidatus Scalindua sp.]